LWWPDFSRGRLSPRAVSQDKSFRHVARSIVLITDNCSQVVCISWEDRCSYRTHHGTRTYQIQTTCPVNSLLSSQMPALFSFPLACQASTTRCTATSATSSALPFNPACDQELRHAQPARCLRHDYELATLPEPVSI
ncbi:mCG144899, partial [Mus musculus]